MQKYESRTIVNNVFPSGNTPVSDFTVQVESVAGGLANIFSDNGVTTKQNPFTVTAADLGRAFFYAASGRYNIVYSVSGQALYTDADVILFDEADSGQSGDMLKSVYDPQAIEADAFSRANHTGTQAQSTILDLPSDLNARVINIGVNPTFASLTFDNGVILNSVEVLTDEIREAKYYTEATQKTGGQLLQSGNYANPISTQGSGGGTVNVQRGNLTVSRGQVVNVSISNVDTSKSFIVTNCKNGRGFSSSTSQSFSVGAAFTSSTNIRFVGGNAPSDNQEDATVYWEAVSYG